MTTKDSALEGSNSSSDRELTASLSFDSLAIDRWGNVVSLKNNTVGTLEPDDVLIRVTYASINKMDPLLAHTNGYNLAVPFVLGFDFSGEVVKLGDHAEQGLKVGEQVFGRTLLGGCFAQYVIAKEDDVFLRRGVPAREASTFGIAYLTAYESLVIAASIQDQRGKWIYIPGAAGGVGHFAVQIAKLHGLRVIGSAGKAASLDILRQLQVAHVIDYSKQDVIHEVLHLTGGKGVDLVYDATYKQSSYLQSAAVIAAGGVYIRLGTAAQVARSGAEDMGGVVRSRGARMVIGDLGRYRVDPTFEAHRRDLSQGLEQAVAWFEQGALKALVTQIVPFEANALQRAFEALLSGKSNAGKIVVQIT